MSARRHAHPPPTPFPTNANDTSCGPHAGAAVSTNTQHAKLSCSPTFGSRFRLMIFSELQQLASIGAGRFVPVFMCSHLHAVNFSERRILNTLPPTPNTQQQILILLYQLTHNNNNNNINIRTTRITSHQFQCHYYCIVCWLYFVVHVHT